MQIYHTASSKPKVAIRRPKNSDGGFYGGGPACVAEALPPSSFEAAHHLYYGLLQTALFCASLRT